MVSREYVHEMKSFDELTFTDNFLFTRVLEMNPKLCVRLTELVTGRKVKALSSDGVSTEHAIKITPDSKGVRLDVVFEDSDALYNIEMQTTKEPGLPKRFRYYQDMTDLSLLQSGAQYEDLKQSYIVFLCTFDAFGQGQVRYEFRNLCVEDPTLELNDETYKLAICAYGKLTEDNPELNALLEYLQGQKSDDPFVMDLDSEVSKAKQSAKTRGEYMRYEIELQRAKDYGRAEGREEGLAEGRLEGSAPFVKLLVEQGMSVEDIAAAGNLTEEEVSAILEATEN